MDEKLKKRIETMMTILNERQLRQYLGAEAESIGYGGIAVVSKLSGKVRNTIIAGIKDNNSGEDFGERIRRTGGGRKSIKNKNPKVIEEIKKVVDGYTYGSPEKPLSYTTKSTIEIAEKLKEKGIKVSHDSVGNILKKELKYSLQQNQKMLQVGESHPNRNEQFEYINEKAKEFLKLKEPVISIDCKKKENIGNFKNNGSTYNPVKTPTKVLDHDFPLKDLGKVAPYGVYDIDKNMGFVNLGVSSDTAEFAVESISRWWNTIGKNTYQSATKLYITSDGGGSNGYKVRLFKTELQEFANQSGLEVHVSHFPRGTSKWNKIEHRLFCFISKHWKGQPLVDVKTVVNLIGDTTTTKGLKVVCVEDRNKYEIGIKVSDEDFEKINIKKDDKFPDWNYAIFPNK